MVVTLPIQEIAMTGRIAAVVKKHDEAIGIGVRKRPQQNCIHYAEDRCVRADSDRERNEGDCREGGCLKKIAERIAKILKKGFHVFFRYRPTITEENME